MHVNGQPCRTIWFDAAQDCVKVIKILKPRRCGSPRSLITNNICGQLIAWRPWF